MNKVIYVSLMMVLLVTLSACSNSVSVSTPTEIPVNITLETDPNPPVVGDVELVFKIEDSQGLPVEGATVNVRADHTDMQGMTMNGAAIHEGDGTYSITANFSMSGNWKITIFLSKDGLSDYQKEFEVRIQ